MSTKQSIILSLLSVTIMITLCGCLSEQTVTSDSGWIDLFNGKDLGGWTPKITGHKFGDDPKRIFRVEDGLLKVSYDQYDKFEGQFGHLFYKDSFSHYILRVEYRFVGEQMPGGPGWAYRNSGVMAHCQDPKTMRVDQEFPVCVEVQMLGGNGKDARSTGNLCTPGTNVVMNGQLETNHCISSNSKTYHGDQWVTMELEVHGNDLIKHIINGQVVMQYTQPQLDETDRDAKELLKTQDLMISEGYFSLQAESHPVEFRKVQIKLLEK
jgi:hypothetical protein